MMALALDAQPVLNKSRWTPEVYVCISRETHYVLGELIGGFPRSRTALVGRRMCAPPESCNHTLLGVEGVCVRVHGAPAPFPVLKFQPPDISGKRRREKASRIVYGKTTMKARNASGPDDTTHRIGITTGE
ncbi:hypothetical protein AAHC03_018959 [Spirometra sp. Aus1]